MYRLDGGGQASEQPVLKLRVAQPETGKGAGLMCYDAAPHSFCKDSTQFCLRTPYERPPRESGFSPIVGEHGVAEGVEGGRFHVLNATQLQPLYKLASSFFSEGDCKDLSRIDALQLNLLNKLCLTVYSSSSPLEWRKFSPKTFLGCT